jgi:hypothetical protein
MATAVDEFAEPEWAKNLAERDAEYADMLTARRSMEGIKKWVGETAHLVGKNVGRDDRPRPPRTFADVVDFILSDPHAAAVIVTYKYTSAVPGHSLIWFVYVDDNMVPQVIQLSRQQAAPYTYFGPPPERLIITGTASVMHPLVKKQYALFEHDPSAYVYDTAIGRYGRALPMSYIRRMS